MTTPSTDRMEEARELARAAAAARIDGKWLDEAAKPIATALSAYEAKGRQDGVREGMKRAAEIARELPWILPMHESAELNELTDDAACMVQEQIGCAILNQIDEAK